MNYLLILVIVAIIGFVIGRRVMRGTKGVQYSVQSIFLRPVLYLILSVALVLGLTLWQTGIIVIAIIVGVFLGRWFGQKSNLFEKDGRVMYTRSNVVLGIWIVAFVLRLVIDFVANPALLASISGSSSSPSIAAIITAGQTSPILFLADVLLAVSAGLLLGEALVLYETFNAVYSSN